MYEQFDGTRNFESPFSPHPECYVYPPVFSPSIPKEEKKKIDYTVKPETKTDEIGQEIKPETVEEVKPETGLTVTNNVSYEVTTDEKKKGFFKRR